jgi:hypothetical protein
MLYPSLLAWDAVQVAISRRHRRLAVSHTRSHTSPCRFRTLACRLGCARGSNPDPA